MVDVVADITDLIGEMETAAMADPISGLLILIGGLIILGSMVVVGWLTIGGVIAAIRASVT